MLRLLNTSILPSSSSAALAVAVPVDLATAKALIAPLDPTDALHGADARGVVSHIGHESTATLLSTLLGVEVPMDRTPWAPYTAPIALVIQVRGRPPEGRVLTVEEIEAIGYDLRVLVVAETVDAIRDAARRLSAPYARAVNDGVYEFVRLPYRPAYEAGQRVANAIFDVVGRPPLVHGNPLRELGPGYTESIGGAIGVVSAT